MRRPRCPRRRRCRRSRSVPSAARVVPVVPSVPSAAGRRRCRGCVATGVVVVVRRATRCGDEREGDRYRGQPEPAFPHRYPPCCAPGGGPRRCKRFHIRSAEVKEPRQPRPSRRADDQLGVADQVLDRRSWPSPASRRSRARAASAPCSTTSLAHGRQARAPRRPRGRRRRQRHVVGDRRGRGRGRRSRRRTPSRRTGRRSPSAGRRGRAARSAAWWPPSTVNSPGADEVADRARARRRRAPARRRRCAGRARRSTPAPRPAPPSTPMRRWPRPSEVVDGDAADRRRCRRGPTGSSSSPGRS